MGGPDQGPPGSVSDMSPFTNTPPPPAAPPPPPADDLATVEPAVEPAVEKVPAWRRKRPRTPWRW